jgi:hypothetical protein
MSTVLHMCLPRYSTTTYLPRPALKGAIKQLQADLQNAERLFTLAKTFVPGR